MKRDRRNFRKDRSEREPRSMKIDLGLGDIVLGRHTIEELLKHDSEALRQVYTSTGDRDQRHSDLVSAIQAAGIPLEFRTQAELTQLAGTPSHQSFVALRKSRQLIDLKQWLEANAEISRLRVVALDSILDPHNTGAVLRACECFGVDLVIWSKNRSSGITPVVSAVSVGASELLSISEVSNLAQAIGALRDEAFQVVVADEGDESIELDQYEPLDRVVLILGSEEHGVQQLIKRDAEIKLKIPMKGRISSLNVSQAAAVLLNRLS